jgi:hypothetical protein
MHSPALGMQCSLVKKQIQCGRAFGSWLVLAPEYNVLKPLYELGLEAKDGSMKNRFSECMNWTQD